MIVIPPIEIDDTRLVSSNVVEDDAPGYDPLATYNTGSEVIYQHYIYECGADGVKGILPTDKTKWVGLRPTNRYAMFNYNQGTKTVSSDIVVTITPQSLITTLVFLDMTCESIHVQVNDSTDGTVYDETFDMADYGVTNWYEYFFTEPTLKRSLIISDLPSYYSAEITVTISNSTGISSCGSMLLGKQKNIGDLKYGMSGGRTDFSTKSTDAFGNYTIVERGSVRRREFPISIYTSNIEDIESFLNSLRALPVLYVGSELKESTIVFGFYKDFDIVMGNAIYSDCSLQVEGVL